MNEDIYKIDINIHIHTDSLFSTVQNRGFSEKNGSSYRWLKPESSGDRNGKPHVSLGMKTKQRFCDRSFRAGFPKPVHSDYFT